MIGSMVKVGMKGTPQVKAMLRRIPYKVNNRKLWMAIFRQTAKPFVQIARQNVDMFDKTSQTKELKKSIKIFTTRHFSKFPAVLVGPKATGGRATKNAQRGGGYYGAMLEYGHGTASPRPFMRPAWEGGKGEVEIHTLKAAQKVVQKILNKEAKKAGGRKLYA
mgnify:CR=1 FL=1